MAKKVYVITGPIGSVKSTAIKYLKNKGFSTVDLDKVSNDILNSDQSIAFLKEEFPEVFLFWFQLENKLQYNQNLYIYF